MKQFMFPLALTLLAVGTVAAQDELFYAKLKTDEVPAEVLTAFSEDFEDGVAVTEYHALPVELVEDTWFVDYNRDKLRKDYDSYEINFSGKGLTGRATYDANGRLISFIEKVNNIALPRPIQKSIGDNFPGWGVADDHEIVSIHKNEHQKVYYRVDLTQGKEKKRVIYDGDGNLVKVNREHLSLNPAYEING
ncbi:MAG: hypothetical protein KDC44_06115 [Phaeodactylibacter sp.]|nr:hypothetical protein [Phaeodactylibacter sp.]